MVHYKSLATSLYAGTHHAGTSIRRGAPERSVVQYPKGEGPPELMRPQAPYPIREDLDLLHGARIACQEFKTTSTCLHLSGLNPYQAL